MRSEPEFNSRGHIILNPIGQDSRFWTKGSAYLSQMLAAVERLSRGGDFTKHDLVMASAAPRAAVYDLLAKLEDYEKLDTTRTSELRPGARDVCPAPARYRLKPGVDLSRFREIAKAHDSNG